MAEKRAKKAAEEAKEAQANEQIRRKSAKVGRHHVSLVDSLNGFSRTLANCETSSRLRKA